MLFLGVVGAGIVTLYASDKKDSRRMRLFMLFLMIVAGFIGMVSIETKFIIFAGIAPLMVAYFTVDKKDSISFRTLMLLLVITAASFGIIYPGVVQYIPRLAGAASALVGKVLPNFADLVGAFVFICLLIGLFLGPVISGLF